jgi:hypothetical protein
MARNTTTGAFAGAAGGVLAAFIMVQYFGGWENASNAEKVATLIGALAAFNIVARSVAP